MIKIVGVTGHRTLAHDYDKIASVFLDEINILKPDAVITGMAVGFDQLVAETCLKADIKYIAAVPFIGQEKMWPASIQKRYHELLGKASKVQIVSDGGYAAWKMHVRNEWIVNNSSTLFAYFDGNDVKGSGTAACCRYCIKKQKPIINIFSKTSSLVL